MTEKADSTGALLIRLLRDNVRPHAVPIGLAAVCMALVAGLTGANAWLLQPAIDEVFIKQSKTMLYVLPAAVLAVAVAKGLATYGQSVLMANVGQRIIAETQVRMYARLIRADLAHLHEIHTGKLISSFLYDANLLRDAVSRAITGMVKDLLTVVALAVVMFVQDWKLAFLTVFIFPLAGFAIRRLGKRMRKVSAATQVETGKLTQHLAETLDGVRLVKAYGMEAYETSRAGAAVERRLKHILKGIRTRSAAAPLTEALGGVAVALAILYGGWQAHAGNMTLGAFTSFLAALLLAYQPIKSLASLNAALQEGLAAAQRIFEVLDRQPEIADAEDARPLAVDGGEVAFEKVGFRYVDGPPAVTDVDLTAPAGKTVALVGPSGAGKSTLLNLLPRFYDTTDGRITIDGQDIRDVTITSLRTAISLVSQDTTLFDDTIRANIAYGRMDATEDDIVAAATAAAAHTFIQALPLGYDTVVGEDGVKLSGGQRQRIAIARAMLKNAPILLLDEATSALDSESERQVQTALTHLMRGRTTLVIAHRLSTVVAADRIYMIENGKIIESGSHAELLARGGGYARLYALQFDDDQRRQQLAGAGA